MSKTAKLWLIIGAGLVALGSGLASATSYQEGATASFLFFAGWSAGAFSAAMSLLDSFLDD